MTWRGWLNFLVFQWTFYRMYTWKDPSDLRTKCGWLGPVWPLTGWWSDYVELCRK